MCVPNHILVTAGAPFGVYRHHHKVAQPNCEFFKTHQMISSI